MRRWPSPKGWSRPGPAISPQFTDRPAEAFWTSTPLPSNPATAYAIDFATGGNLGIDNPMTTSLRARCVR